MTPSIQAPINTIDPEAVYRAFLDCLFRPDEVREGKIPENAVMVEAIRGKFGLHPERLESHRSEVRAWLALLPRQFRKSGGGGWSFLNACDQEGGAQWTGLHERMEQLCAMGIGLNLAQFLLPRDLWEMLPGGMPFVMIDLPLEEASEPSHSLGDVSTEPAA
jgi:hypothetical protein